MMKFDKRIYLIYVINIAKFGVDGGRVGVW